MTFNGDPLAELAAATAALHTLNKARTEAQATLTLLDKFGEDLAKIADDIEQTIARLKELEVRP